MVSHRVSNTRVMRVLSGVACCVRRLVLSHRVIRTRLLPTNPCATLWMCIDNPYCKPTPTDGEWGYLQPTCGCDCLFGCRRQMKLLYLCLPCSWWVANADNCFSFYMICARTGLSTFGHSIRRLNLVACRLGILEYNQSLACCQTGIDSIRVDAATTPQSNG